jgi:hypothetical protein
MTVALFAITLVSFLLAAGIYGWRVSLRHVPTEFEQRMEAMRVEFAKVETAIGKALLPALQKAAAAINAFNREWTSSDESEPRP